MPIPVFTSRIVADATWTLQADGGSLQTFATTQYYHLITGKTSAGNGQSFLHALKLLLDASSGLTWTAELTTDLKVKLTHDSGSSQTIAVPEIISFGLGFTAGMSWTTAGGDEEEPASALCNISVPATTGNTGASRPAWLWSPEMAISGVGPEQFDPAYTSGVRSSAGSALRSPDGTASFVTNGRQVEAEFIFNGVQPYRRAYRPPFDLAQFGDDFASWWKYGPRLGRSVLFWRNKTSLVTGTTVLTGVGGRTPRAYVEYYPQPGLRERPPIRASVPGNLTYWDISVPLWLTERGEAEYA